MNAHTGRQLDLTKVLAGVSARSLTEPELVADPALVRLQPREYQWHYSEDVIDWLLDNLQPLDNPSANTNCEILAISSRARSVCISPPAT